MKTIRVVVLVLMALVSGYALADITVGQTAWIQGDPNFNNRYNNGLGGSINQVGNNYYGGSPAGQYVGNQPVQNIDYTEEVQVVRRECNQYERDRQRRGLQVDGLVIGGIAGQIQGHTGNSTARGAGWGFIAGTVASYVVPCEVNEQRIIRRPIIRQQQVAIQQQQVVSGGNSWNVQGGQQQISTVRVTNAQSKVTLPNGKDVPNWCREDEDWRLNREDPSKRGCQNKRTGAFRELTKEQLADAFF